MNIDPRQMIPLDPNAVTVPPQVGPIGHKPGAVGSVEYVSGQPRLYYAQYIQSLPQYIDDLSQELGDDIYDRILIDPQVNSCYSVYKAYILSQTANIVPAIDKKKDPHYEKAAEVADFCNRAIESLEMSSRRSFESILWEMLDGLIYGHRLGEIVTESDQSLSGKTETIIRDIKVKPRGTTAFVVDAFYRVIGVVAVVPGMAFPIVAGQLIAAPQHIPNLLPREKFCVFTNNPKTSDPRGRSILRTCYQPWWLKQQTWGEWLKYLAQFATPSLYGVTAEGAQAIVPTDDAGNPTGAPITPEQAMLEMLKAVQNGSVAAVPYGAGIYPIPVGQGDNPHLNAIALCDKQIAKAILAQTLATEEAEHMARAASETHADVLDIGTRYPRRQLSSMVRNDILHLLTMMNFGPVVAKHLTPKYQFPETKPSDWAEYAAAATSLVTSGYVTPGQKAFIDKKLGLPEAEGPTLGDMEKQQQQAAEMLQQQQQQQESTPVGEGSGGDAGLTRPADAGTPPSPNESGAPFFPPATFNKGDGNAEDVAKFSSDVAFFKDGGEYGKMGCVLFNLPKRLSIECLKIANDIKKKANVVEIEDKPHITIFYGYDQDRFREIVSECDQFGPIMATLGNISVFENNAEFDVVKIDVDSPELHRLWHKLDVIPNKKTYSEYKPHVTLAYVKKGEGKKFFGSCSLTGKEIVITDIIYSDKDEATREISLCEPKEAHFGDSLTANLQDDRPDDAPKPVFVNHSEPNEPEPKAIDEPKPLPISKEKPKDVTPISDGDTPPPAKKHDPVQPVEQKKPEMTMVQKLTDIGQSVMKGTAKISDTVKGYKESALSKLNPKLRMAVVGTLKTTYSVYNGAEAFAQEVMKESGHSPEKVKALATGLTISDYLLGGKVLPAVAVVAGVDPTIALASAYASPIGSLAYLAYSAATNREATLRAARNIVNRITKREKPAEFSDDGPKDPASRHPGTDDIGNRLNAGYLYPHGNWDVSSPPASTRSYDDYISRSTGRDLDSISGLNRSQRSELVRSHNEANPTARMLDFGSFHRHVSRHQHQSFRDQEPAIHRREAGTTRMSTWAPPERLEVKPESKETEQERLERLFQQAISEHNSDRSEMPQRQTDESLQLEDDEIPQAIHDLFEDPSPEDYLGDLSSHYMNRGVPRPNSSAASGNSDHSFVLPHGQWDISPRNPVASYNRYVDSVMGEANHDPRAVAQWNERHPRHQILDFSRFLDLVNELPHTDATGLHTVAFNTRGGRFHYDVTPYTPDRRDINSERLSQSYDDFDHALLSRSYAENGIPQFRPLGSGNYVLPHGQRDISEHGLVGSYKDYIRSVMGREHNGSADILEWNLEHPQHRILTMSEFASHVRDLPETRSSGLHTARQVRDGNGTRYEITPYDPSQARQWQSQQQSSQPNSTEQRETQNVISNDHAESNSFTTQSNYLVPHGDWTNNDELSSIGAWNQYVTSVTGQNATGSVSQAVNRWNHDHPDHMLMSYSQFREAIAIQGDSAMRLAPGVHKVGEEGAINIVNPRALTQATAPRTAHDIMGASLSTDGMEHSAERYYNIYKDDKYKIMLSNSSASEMPEALKGLGIEGVHLRDIAGAGSAVEGAEVRINTSYGEINISVKHPQYHVDRDIKKDYAGRLYIANNGAYRDGGESSSGISKKFVIQQIDSAVKIGAKYIEMCAAGRGNGSAEKRREGEYIGYYVWPSFGFDWKLDGSRYERFKTEFRKEFGVIPKTIQEVYSMKGEELVRAKKLWYMYGDGNGQARLDLTKRRNIEKAREYAARKKEGEK